jgi:pyruvate-ferredoxin/flavodoxin oxidoreductase
MNGIEPQASVSYPGLPVVTDGSGAVVWVETHVTQGACAYPITPSTNMGVDYAQAVADGQLNLWGEPLVFLEPESEHSSASAAEGFALAGGRVTNFTCGQGLVLMKEVLYVISGKRLPVVFNVGARALTSHALNIHCGHDDVMAVADTGWGMLFAKNAQEAGDLCLIARRAAEAAQTPFFNVQDGFLTTHTLESVRLPEPELMKAFLGPPSERLLNLFDPSRPLQSGVVQNQDAYMKGKIAQRFFYEHVEAAVEQSMEALSAATGRRYETVERYRMDDAEYAILALGSMAETAMATVDHLRGEGVRCGVVHLTCFRPFPARRLVAALGACRAVAVIERIDNPLAQSNPLACELKSALADALSGHPDYPPLARAPEVYCGVAGLGGRDVRPGDFVSVVRHMATGSRRTFVLGIPHPQALERAEDPDLGPADAFRMRGHSIGGYGSVTTNKVIAAVLGEVFGLQVQAYPVYGSEKKGLPTTYYLTAARSRIRTHCELARVDFVPVSTANAFSTGNPLAGLAPGGTVFLQSTKTSPDDVWREIPHSARRTIRTKRLHVLYLDAAKIAAEVSTRRDLEVRMQGIVLLGVFLRVLPRELGAVDDVLERVAPAIRKYLAGRGETVVQENLTCIRRGFSEVSDVPRPVMSRDLERQSLRLAGLRVADVMTTGVVACRRDTPLPEVLTTMQERDVSAIVVVDEQQRVEGVLSVTDLRRAHVEQLQLGEYLPEIQPAHLMSRDVLTTWPEEPLSDAVDRLFDHHVHRLVVTASTADRIPIGILSASDLLALLPGDRSEGAA